jgi:hypothetical protein
LDGKIKMILTQRAFHWSNKFSIFRSYIFCQEWARGFIWGISECQIRSFCERATTFDEKGRESNYRSFENDFLKSFGPNSFRTTRIVLLCLQAKFLAHDNETIYFI